MNHSLTYSQTYLGRLIRFSGKTVLIQVLALAFMPLLARVYTPVQFGELALLTSGTAIASTAVTLRLELAIPVARSRQMAQALAVSSLLSIALFTVAGWLGVWLLQPWLDQPGWPSARLCTLAMLGGALLASANTLQQWCVRQRHHAALTRYRAVNTLATIGLQLASFAAGWQQFGLQLGYLGGFGLGVAYLVAVLRRDQLFRHLNLRKLAASRKRFRSYPTHLLPAAVLDSATLQLPTLLINQWFGKEWLGLYALMHRVLSVPGFLVGASVGQFFQSEFTTRIHAGHEGRSLLFSTWRLLATVWAPLWLALAAFGPWLFGLVFGANWHSSGELARVFGIMYFFMFCSAPTSTALLALGRQRLSPYFGLYSLLTRSLAFYCGYLGDSILLAGLLFSLFEIFGIVMYNAIILKTEAARGLARP